MAKKFINAYRKTKFKLPEYIHFEFPESQNTNTYNNSGLTGDYVVTGQFNNHPVYSNRVK